jgi:AcrR family transcriptional regulator
MPKLQKSIEKKAALLQATLTLVNEAGFQGASMARIAKEANVSPATIYLYFKNKQDLVNQLYLEVKSSFSDKAFKDMDENLAVKSRFEHIWYNIADFKFNQIEEALFLSQCDNTPIIDEDIRKEGLKHLQPLIDLWDQGKEEGVIKNISHYLMYAMTIYPMAFLMNKHVKIHCEMSELKLRDAFNAAWDSIKE